MTCIIYVQHYTRLSKIDVENRALVVSSFDAHLSNTLKSHVENACSMACNDAAWRATCCHDEQIDWVFLLHIKNALNFSKQSAIR
jgi:hypothetical protein